VKAGTYIGTRGPSFTPQWGEYGEGTEVVPKYSNNRIVNLTKKRTTEDATSVEVNA
jgi:hypothetical protein